MTLRKRLYLTLDPTEKGGTAERIFEVILVSTIILNILEIILDSVGFIHDQNKAALEYFELFSVVFFTLEYIARVYSIVENPKFSHPIKGRLKYMVSPLAIVDLLAICPYYIAWLTVDLRFLRLFRLMTVFRIFKIVRYLHALNIFKRVLKDRKEQLVLSFFFILFVLVIISFVMYYAEHDAQPDKFSSIPATMWWGIATLTTVSYGDMVPITPVGKFLAGIFAIVGVALLALPVGILSSGFFEMLHTTANGKKVVKKCPHCGEEIHE
jgi:voltage-gated potassium channel